MSNRSTHSMIICEKVDLFHALNEGIVRVKKYVFFPNMDHVAMEILALWRMLSYNIPGAIIEIHIRPYRLIFNFALC